METEVQKQVLQRPTYCSQVSDYSVYRHLGDLHSS